MTTVRRLLWVALLLVPFLATAEAVASPKLDPTTLTKYIDALPIPGAMPQAAPNYYEIGAWEIHQQLHSELPPTYLFGYGTSQATASYPAATIVAQRGVPIDIRWTNHLGFDHPLSYAFDPTLEHAITTTGIPITPHVHGAEVEPQSDGGPLTWFTPNFAEKGPDWQKEIYHYANDQLPATIWYHDHAFGYTRHNVYAGLAGYYIVQDPANEPANLPSGPYEVPLAIQDKSFTTDGQLWYPVDGDNEEHPIWVPEFFGDVNLVNGKVWPYLEVEPRKYRFRILNGSNARFYSLALSERIQSTPGPAFAQIGSDGGYLPAVVILNDPSVQGVSKGGGQAKPASPRLLLAPGERADVIIDFSDYAPGTEFLLKNTAKAPYPMGESPNPQTTGQVMLMRVVPLTAPDTSVLPVLPAITQLANPVVTRTLTLNELEGREGPLGALLNGMTFMNGETLHPTLGATELWEVVNMTADTHPIHLHLVQFQMLNRQKFHARRYETAFLEANPVLPSDQYVPVPVDPYLRGNAIPPDANERGWKDTFRMNPDEVTRILVRFAPQDDSPSYAFDATAAPGYVWHCHILEHEENDMMQRYELLPPQPPAISRSDDPSTRVVPATLELVTPNPVRAPDEVRFRLPSAGEVKVGLYAADGRLVRTLANGRFEAGEHPVSLVSGGALRSGVYFLRIQTNADSRIKKLILLP